jgi:2-methylcitrate dehydratase PrpD
MPDVQQFNASRRIAMFSVGFNRSNMTAALLEQVSRALLDTWAGGVAGSAEPASQHALRYLNFYGGCDHTEYMGASLWGRAGRYPLESAALWNGIAAHVLDYDDVTSPLRGHPSVAMLPALVALAEALDLKGSHLACAYVVGFEVICKIAKAMAVDHYAKGWHSTASIGTIGAAVACAHLLQLDVEQTMSAIGLAVSQAAGTRANFGSHAKAFQAGHSNAAGLRAALLAREGFTAAGEALDSEIGYTALYGNGEELAPQLETLGSLPLELERSGIEIKKYPLCYATHRALDGLLALREGHGLTLDNVERVTVRTSKGALAPLVHHRPTSGLQAKFSMEYAVAAALHDGGVKLDSFVDAAVLRPEIQAFLARVSSADAAQGEVFPRWTEIVVDRRGETSLTCRVEQLRGSAQLPLTLAELGAKVADCLAWGKSDVDAETLVHAANTMAHRTVRQFLQSGRPVSLEQAGSPAFFS